MSDSSEIFGYTPKNYKIIDKKSEIGQKYGLGRYGFVIDYDVYTTKKAMKRHTNMNLLYDV